MFTASSKMPLNAEMLAKLGPAFGAVPVMVFQNSSAVATIEAAAPINILSDRVFTKAEEDILRLLSDGHSADTVSTTLGITPSQISQYLAKDDFRAELASRKSLKLDKYKKLDDGYDELEQSVLTKLKEALVYVSKPGELTAILSRLNAAKRRMGDSAVSSAVPVQTIVQVVLPTTLVHQFTKTAEGHVVAVDSKSLVTMPSGALASLAFKNNSVENAKLIEGN